MWLQATLPSKPHINKVDDYQQSFSLGRNATADEAGLKFALIKAKIINGQLAQGTFNWEDWLDIEKVAPHLKNLGTIGDWVEKYEKVY